MCIVCQQEGLIGGLVDDSPIVLVARIGGRNRYVL